MIGQLTFWMSAKRHTVTLNDQLQWECDDPEITEYLNETFPIHPDVSLSSLAIGRHALYRAAERLNGRVQVSTRRHPPAAAGPA
ncbi:hypothetical protein [Algisphaera agarilytica]|nr:hypothetical protein [Algisphaera agarilytica]